MECLILGILGKIFVASPNYQESEMMIGMWCAHHKSISLIFKEPINFPMDRIKHKIFIHRPKTARDAARRGLVDRTKICTDSLHPCCSRLEQRRPRFKFGHLDPRSGAISALAFDQVCLGRMGSPKTRICARKGPGLVEISTIPWVAPPEAWRRMISDGRAYLNHV